MFVETMVTEAVLRDSFTPVLRKIAAQQDAFAQRTSKLNTAANVGLMAGGAGTKLAVDAIKTAAAYDQQRKAYITLLGDAERGKQLFKDLAEYSTVTPFNFTDWQKASQMLLGFGVQAEDLKPILESLGNAVASTGGDGTNLEGAARAVGQMYAGTLKMQEINQLVNQGIPAAKLLREQLHLSGAELQAIGNQHISGKIGVEALRAAIMGGNMKSGMSDQMNTLNGAVSNLQDNWKNFLADMGDPALQPLTRLVNKSGDLLGNLQKMDPAVQKMVAFLGLAAGPTTVVAASILKGIVAWRNYKAAVETDAAVSKIERAGESEKVGVAAKEGAAVEGAAVKYGGLAAKLEGVASKAGIVNATALRGVGVLGLYGVALAGLAADAYLVVNALKELGDASENVEKAQQANADARKMGYDVKQSHVTGAGSKSIWKQYAYELSQSWAASPLLKYGVKALWGKDFDEPTGFTALTDAKTRAAAKKHGMPAHGVRAQQIAAQKAAAEKAAAARRQAAEDAANSYRLDPALDYKLKQDERRVALLEAQKASQDKINAAKKQEIADLMKASDLLRAQAKIATDPKAKYRLLDEADEDAQKAKLLALDKTKADKDGFDKTSATILGAAGLGEDEILKRTGIGKRFFASMGKGSLPPDPLKAALAKIGKQDIHVTLALDGKAVQTITVKVENEVAKALAQVLGGSNRRLLPN